MSQKNNNNNTNRDKKPTSNTETPQNATKLIQAQTHTKATVRITQIITTQPDNLFLMEFYVFIWRISEKRCTITKYERKRTSERE